jgi:hypothetical protein
MSWTKARYLLTFAGIPGTMSKDGAVRISVQKLGTAVLEIKNPQSAFAFISFFRSFTSRKSFIFTVVY